MKKFVLLILSFVVLQANAQILYEISGNGLKKPSYILGTHHAIAVSSIAEVKNVFKCFNDCDAVIGEIVVDEHDMANKMLHMAAMEQSITDYLTPEEELLVDSALQAELGLTLQQVGHMRPAMIQNIYEMTIYEKLFPRKDKDSQMDSFFQRAATELNKPIYGLETVEEQLKLLFHRQSIERQAEMLVESVKTSGSIKEEMNNLNKLYLDGDITALYEWMTKSEGYSEADKFLFIDERNTNWIEKLDKHIRKTSCFIAVGAMHLPGRLGLIELLRKKGYHVKPVK